MKTSPRFCKLRSADCTDATATSGTRNTALAFSSFEQPSVTQFTPIVRPSDSRSVLGADVWLNPDMWRNEAVSKIRALTTLPIGWDGYQGKPVSNGNATLAIQVLQRIAMKGVPTPSFVPMPNGGIQFEWHRKSWDLEVTITAPNHIEVFAYNLADSKELNFQLESDLEILLGLVKAIAD